MIYKGPSYGQGISVYKDGLHVGDDYQLAPVGVPVELPDDRKVV